MMICPFWLHSGTKKINKFYSFWFKNESGLIILHRLSDMTIPRSASEQNYYYL